MKKPLILFLLIPMFAFAATYTTKRGDTLSDVAQKTGVTVEQLAAANPNLKIERGQKITYPNPAPTNTPNPEPQLEPQTEPESDPISESTGDEIGFTAYLTGWGYPDNDPRNSDTTYNSGILGHAGGIGTYEDPISMAVGYVGEESDYSYGTMFYVPNLRAYFQVVDTCASCHKGQNDLVWLDLWHGGQGSRRSSVISCEESHTGNYLVIQNPAPNYAVIAGPLYDSRNGCRPNFGDMIVME